MQLCDFVTQATILPAAELPVPADKFSAEFGEEWATVLAEGRAFNAMATCEHLGNQCGGAEPCNV